MNKQIKRINQRKNIDWGTVFIFVNTFLVVMINTSLTDDFLMLFKLNSIVIMYILLSIYMVSKK